MVKSLGKTNSGEELFDNGMVYRATLLSRPINKSSKDWKETAYHWNVSFYNQNNGGSRQSFDYYMGAGHNGKRPSLDDILYCLVSDAEACETSFEDWCDNLGYDTDSRKALQDYLDCQETASKLRKAGVDIAAERERLANY